MKFGHCTGHKKEKPARTPNFDAIQAAWLAQIEARQADQVRQAQPHQAAAKEQAA